MSLAAAKHYLRKVFHYSLPRTAAARAMAHSPGDEFEVRILDLLVDPDREAMDVGANIGQYAFHLAKLSTRVWVFEPIPDLAFILTKTLPPNAVVENKAVSSVRGHVTLCVPYNEEGFASVESNRLLHSEAILVPTVLLDDYADLNIGFVKIDVEGHELQVLSGANKLIERHRPTFLIEAEERHKPGTTSEIFSRFAQKGYRGFFVYNRQVLGTSKFSAEEMQNVELIMAGGARSTIPYVNNFIFVPEELARKEFLRAIQARAANINEPTSA